MPSFCFTKFSDVTFSFSPSNIPHQCLRLFGSFSTELIGGEKVTVVRKLLHVPLCECVCTCNSKMIMSKAVSFINILLWLPVTTKLSSDLRSYRLLLSEWMDKYMHSEGLHSWIWALATFQSVTSCNLTGNCRKQLGWLCPKATTSHQNLLSSPFSALYLELYKKLQWSVKTNLWWPHSDDKTPESPTHM